MLGGSQGLIERANHGLRQLPKQIKFAIAEGVMDQPASRLRRQVRHTDEVKHRNVLGIGTGDSIRRAQLAHAVGGTDRSDAANQCLVIADG